MRRRKAGSVDTKARGGATASSTPRRAATGAKAVASESKSGCRANHRFSGLEAPASSLEISSSASSSDSTAPRLASILPPRSLPGSRSIIAAVNRRAACKGCTRSWLAAAMKRGLPGVGAALEPGRRRDDTLLQGLGRLAKLAVAFAQGLSRVHARRHVVAGGDEAAAGQRIGAQFDDAAFAGGGLVGLRGRGT